MSNTKNAPGKFLYALLFLVVVPAALWFWARATEYLVRYPAIESDVAGWIFTIAGGLLMLWGMYALRKHGKGLPMNSFPPSQFVQEGPYRLFRHPIYWGFGIFMIGFFISTGSASGLWLVTPVTILGMMALVWGYEKIDLAQRFPGKTLKTVLDLPEDTQEATSPRDRLVSAFWVVGLLMLGNYLTLHLSGNTSPLIGDPVHIHPVFDRPFLPVLSLVFVVSVPFLLKRKYRLLEWVVSAILGLILSVFLALVFPAIGAQYLSDGNAANSIHSGLGLALFTAPIFLIFLSFKAIYRQSYQLPGILSAIIAFLLSIVQLANSRSSILHLATSLVIFSLVANYSRVWAFLKNNTEMIANSWHEWVFGKIRVINHGFYVGFGTFLSILIAGILSGKKYAWAILVFAFLGIIFAALWAQIIEGSEKLKRPFGYYGSLVSIPFAMLAFRVMGVDGWIMIAVVSVVMPWAQAIGRLRCLVNGCCHGGPVDNPNIGIRYFHARSRVCGISGLKGQLLHPTQLYAIIWLFFVGFILLALWNNHYSAAFIFGLYLIMTGIGRFVEEAYRGEVQTVVFKGLRLYQWTAILSVIIGIILTKIPTEQVASTPGFGWETLAAAIIGGLFACFAMGVDFPYSNARFSRLV